MIRNKMRSMMWNKVDESVLPVEGQIDQSDNIVSQAKGGINSLGKEQLPGQDCGCTNSGDGGAGDWSAVCDCVVGKSVGGDFQGEKRDDDCFDDLNVPLIKTQTMKASRPFLIPCFGCRRVKLRIRAPTMAETETTNLTLTAA
ncbi:hypothetical protein BgiBS90_027533 [Biomphalaria glabrata]|nr:hypothetical protein BgiBS90_027533 [Biomphalaria glabrata]